MHNPLYPFTTDLLKVLIERGFTIFVRQTYPRGKDHFDTDIKETFLITPYKDIGEANQHFQYIQYDRRKYIYQIHRPEELQKLQLAASQPPGYRVFSDKLASDKWRPSQQMAAKISNYLRTNTKWKASDHDVSINLFLHYGDLMLRLSNGTDEMKILLSEIECI